MQKHLQFKERRASRLARGEGPLAGKVAFIRLGAPDGATVSLVTHLAGLGADIALVFGATDAPVAQLLCDRVASLGRACLAIGPVAGIEPSPGARAIARRFGAPDLVIDLLGSDGKGEETDMSMPAARPPRVDRLIAAIRLLAAAPSPGP